MIAIRRSKPCDCEVVFSLARAFATSFVVERPAFESSFSALLESPDAFLAIADDGERTAGYVLGFDHRTFFANGRVSWVEEIMVVEGMRRQGVGRQLMQSFEAWARQRQSRLVALATRRAASFYRSIGYEESATYFRKSL
jgi:GNAT superfamily N-acetyltransferase